MNPLFFLDFRVRGAPTSVADLPSVRDANDRAVGAGASSLQGLGSAFASLTFLVHGFNVSRAEAMAAYGAFVARIPPGAAATCFVGLLWPGDVPLLHAFSYPLEMGPADKTADRFAACIASWVRPAQMSIVAHSLGCRVALRAVTRLGAAQAVNELVLLAGAVDCDAIARSDRYRDAIARTRRAIVVSSTADRVLEYAFPVGDFVSTLFVRPDTQPALGRVGARPWGREVVPAMVASVAVGSFQVDHGDYFPSRTPRAQADGIARLVSEALAGAAKPEFT